MPEVVFLFTTIDYADSADILEGLHDGLEKDCIVIGNSGDGFYETEGANDFGASALGLNIGVFEVSNGELFCRLFKFAMPLWP